MKHTGFVWRLCACLGICAAASLSVTAAAQNAQPADGESLDEIVVTGSRVITNGNESPTPVTVISTDQLLLANPANLAAAIAMLPSVLGSPTQGGQSGTNFQAVLNLRGIGGQRNLILFDGHRIVPTTVLGGVQSGVDSNLIPTMLLKRVDVVTGGASAVYGSDAVSGVINYVVDNNFNGVKFNVQSGMSTYRDDKTYNLGIAAGMPIFANRGHIEFSVQEIRDSGLQDRFDREWGRGLYSQQGSVVGSTAGAGSINNPYLLYKNSRFAVTTFGGLINSGATNGPLADLQFSQNGVLSPFVHGTRTGSAGAEVGGDGGYYTTYDAFGAQKQNLGLARFDYSITDDMKFYAEVAFGTVLNTNHLANAEVRTRAIGYNNAYLATIQPQYRALLPAALQTGPTAIGTIGATGSFNFSRIFQPDQFAAPLNDARGTQVLYLTGLEGLLGEYKWNLGFEHSKATFKVSNPNNINSGRLYAALNAVVNPANGQIVCNAALVNPAVYGNCVPLNAFGPTSVSAAAYDYVNQYTWYRVNSGLDDFTASISGAPFNSWAGPIAMALSGDYRRQTYGIDSNAQSTDPINCTGIQFNCNATLAPYVGAVTNSFPEAHLTVGELAFESQVPLLKDKFLARSLSLNGAARYTDYSTSGIVYTWKVGLTWAPSDSLNLRATRSRDIRAPNLRDLYAPASCNNISFTDIHTNNTPGTVQSCTTGNADLQPEKADTYTVGFVWTPSFIDGMSMSIDGYDVNMGDALNSVSVTQPASQQACELSGGTSLICSLYIRPFPFSNTTAANYPTRVNNVTLNTGSVKIRGIDAEIAYARQIAGHQFSGRLLMNYQPTYDVDQGPAGLLFAGGAADSLAGLLNTPDLKGMLQLNYEVVNDLTFTLQERFRNSLKQHASPVLYFAWGDLPSAFYTDLTLSYAMHPADSDVNIFLNVKNAFNKQPDPYAASGANAQIGSLGGYLPGEDVIGRYFTLGVRVSL